MRIERILVGVLSVVSVVFLVLFAVWAARCKNVEPSCIDCQRLSPPAFAESYILQLEQLLKVDTGRFLNCVEWNLLVRYLTLAPSLVNVSLPTRQPTLPNL
jgi:hypothetical protein